MTDFASSFTVGSTVHSSIRCGLRHGTGTGNIPVGLGSSSASGAHSFWILDGFIEHRQYLHMHTDGTNYLLAFNLIFPHTMRFTTKLIPSRSGNLGILLLNNPKPLHALTLDMMHCFQDVLKLWYQDDSVAAVLVKAGSDTKIPAFCAGGDVKQVYLAGKKDTGDEGKPVVHGQGVPGVDTAEFFRQEYYVNHMLATAVKPQISLWDGIVMGGGAGISIHGKYRVATENTVFAMPETAIGLFPDVGSMYWMPRLLKQRSVATYLALTGERLKAPDLIHTGLATHYVPSAKLVDLEAALVSASLKRTETHENIVAPVLLSFHEHPQGEPTLNGPAIDQAFGNVTSVEEIMTALNDMQDTDFGRRTLESLSKMSPTSLKVTMEGLRRGAMCQSITEDLKMEYRMSQAFIRKGSDFYEGLRAVLIDKDNSPMWNPARLENVTDSAVQSHFDPITHEWEILSELIIEQTKASKL